MALSAENGARIYDDAMVIDMTCPLLREARYVNCSFNEEEMREILGSNWLRVLERSHYQRNHNDSDCRCAFPFPSPQRKLGSNPETANPQRQVLRMKRQRNGSQIRFGTVGGCGFTLPAKMTLL
jgi:hypothetical protein